MASIKDVAKEAGVAPSTVSAVVNGLNCVKPATKERVEIAIKKLGYTPNLSARALVTKKSLTIGVLLISYDTQENTDFHGVPDNLSDCAAQEDISAIIQAFGSDRYSLIFERFSFHPDQETLPAMVQQKRVDAIFVLGSLYSNTLITRLQEHVETVVAVGCYTPGAPCVYNNYAASVQDAVAYLIANGHRRIAYVEGDIDSEPRRQKHLGYAAALEKAQIPYDPSLVLQSSFLVSAGYCAAEKILALEDRPTAILFGADSLAIGAYLCFADRGIRIPEDISVMGYENLFVSAFLNPPLTTVDMGKKAIAQAACRLMTARLDHTANGQNSIQIPAPVVVRGSVSRDAK